MHCNKLGRLLRCNKGDGLLESAAAEYVPAHGAGQAPSGAQSAREVVDQITCPPTPDNASSLQTREILVHSGEEPEPAIHG